ncbi:MAG: RAP domain-containing protein, partial [Phycisphaerales bacterium]
MAQPDSKTAVDFDGPSHFLTDVSGLAIDPGGPALFKRRVLRRLGWRVWHMPYYEWDGLHSKEAQEEYLARGLAELRRADPGADSPPPPTTVQGDADERPTERSCKGNPEMEMPSGPLAIPDDGRRRPRPRARETIERGPLLRNDDDRGPSPTRKRTRGPSPRGGHERSPRAPSRPREGGRRFRRSRSRSSSTDGRRRYHRRGRVESWEPRGRSGSRRRSRSRSRERRRSSSRGGQERSPLAPSRPREGGRRFRRSRSRSS